MKIGFLINDLTQGGAQRAAVSLANYFQQQGYQAEIITFEQTDSFYQIDESVSVVSVGFKEIEQSFSLKRLNSTIKRMVSLRKFIKSRNLDILIGMSFSMTYYSVFSTKFTSTKSVGTERSNPFVYKATRLNTILRRIFYRLADGYVLQTKKSAEFFDGGKLKNGIVIPNAIYNTKIYTLPPVENRDKIIFSAGRLSEEKCYDLLIDSFDLIKSEIPDYNLIIFGDGPEKEKLENKISDLSLNGRVFLPGADENAIEQICKGSVFVLSSRFEGMPNALMEALAMGVPCVSTKCETGPEELINNGENGLLVDVGSKEHIASAILKIIHNPTLAKKLSENGKKLILTNSIDRISNQWLSYLKNL